jgi:hypothetical protein
VTLESGTRAKGSNEVMMTVAVMEGLSIRILTYSVPKKGVTNGFKRGEERL